MTRPGTSEFASTAVSQVSPPTVLNVPAAEFSIWRPAQSSSRTPFRWVAVATNFLLVLAACGALASWFWEYSTQRYVKGFADAIIPASASDEQKVQSILDWMSHGPARDNTGEDLDSSEDRDPTYTLNYAKLLQACGTATNAFLNLADSGGLKARRLLLLDSRGTTVHVVAEVWLDGRWAAADPAYRTLLRGSRGQLLTIGQLADPAVLASATRGIRGYPAAYDYRNATHVRFARLGSLGLDVEAALNRTFPQFEPSTIVSLVLERRSLAALVFFVGLVLLLAAARILELAYVKGAAFRAPLTRRRSTMVPE